MLPSFWSQAPTIPVTYSLGYAAPPERPVVPLLLLIIVIAIAFWLGKEYSNARRRQNVPAVRASRTPARGQTRPQVSEDSLKEHATQLRAAVRRGDISHEEAVGSLLRFSGSALSAEGAARLLRS